VVGAVLSVIVGGLVAAYIYYKQNMGAPAAPKLSPQRISDWGAATRTCAQEIPTLNPLSNPAVGSVVILKGLTSTPELNGVQGKITGMDATTGRYSIALLNDPSRILAVKPTCVDVAMPPPSAPASQVFTCPDGRQYTYNAATGETAWLPLPGSTTST